MVLTNILQFLTNLSHSSLLATLSTLPTNTNTTDTGRTLSASYSSSYGDECCPPVVDPYTWAALIGGIALATFFLQMQIVANISGRRRRRRSEMGEDKINGIMTGWNLLILTEGDLSVASKGLGQFEANTERSDGKMLNLSENILLSFGREALEYQNHHQFATALK